MDHGGDVRSDDFVELTLFEGDRESAGRRDRPRRKGHWLSWRRAAPDGQRFTDDDAEALTGAWVTRATFHSCGVVERIGPGIITSAKVVESGAAMQITMEA